jgi:hypothetical protein
MFDSLFSTAVDCRFVTGLGGVVRTHLHGWRSCMVFAVIMIELMSL